VLSLVAFVVRPSATDLLGAAIAIGGARDYRFRQPAEIIATEYQSVT
jgi:hypothetical protein